MAPWVPIRERRKLSMAYSTRTMSERVAAAERRGERLPLHPRWLRRYMALKHDRREWGSDPDDLIGE